MVGEETVALYTSEAAVAEMAGPADVLGRLPDMWADGSEGRDAAVYATHLGITRDDLKTAGYDGTAASEEQMNLIAKRVSNSEAVMEAWWLALGFAADEAGLPAFDGIVEGDDDAWDDPEADADEEEQA